MCDAEHGCLTDNAILDSSGAEVQDLSIIGYRSNGNFGNCVAIKPGVSARCVRWHDGNNYCRVACGCDSQTGAFNDELWYGTGDGNWVSNPEKHELWCQRCNYVNLPVAYTSGITGDQWCAIYKGDDYVCPSGRCGECDGNSCSLGTPAPGHLGASVFASTGYTSTGTSQEP